MTLTIGDLKELIKDLPDTMQVIMSSDGEGNSFSPLDSHAVGKYTPESTWQGEWWQDPTGEPGFNPEDWDEEDLTAPEDGVDAICFWPVN